MEEVTISPPLLHKIRDVRARSKNLLRAGAVLHPLMDEDARTRYGRVVAAQLADLAIRRHLWFYYGTEYLGPKGLMAARHPDPSDTPDPDEQRLLDLLFGADETTRIARPRPWAQWSDLATEVRQGVHRDGHGWLRRDRYQLMRDMTALKKAMSRHARVPDGRPWSRAPELYRGGLPLAVLFNIDTGFPHWPWPPEEELFLPSQLPSACHMAHFDAT